MSAYNSVPNIADIGPQTSYREMKEILAQCREAIIGGWMQDGEGTTVVDAVGGVGRQTDIKPQVGAAGTSVLPPLTLISANDGDPKGSIIFGTVAGLDITPSVFSVSDGDHAWVALAVSYNDSTGIWSVSSATLDSGASVPAGDATNAYVNLGTFTVSGSAATAFPALSGSQGWRRCGNSDGFQDNFFQGGL